MLPHQKALDFVSGSDPMHSGLCDSGTSQLAVPNDDLTFQGLDRSQLAYCTWPFLFLTTVLTFDKGDLWVCTECDAVRSHTNVQR